LTFDSEHPFTNGLFDPMLRPINGDKPLLSRIENDFSTLNSADLTRMGFIVKDFPDYQELLGATYLKIIKEIYRLGRLQYKFDEPKPKLYSINRKRDLKAIVRVIVNDHQKIVLAMSDIYAP
jgi:hypothetical protein